MNFSVNSRPVAEAESLRTTSVNAVLVREAGVPFQPQPSNPSNIDPFIEWLSLMEVVQMLCPEWPARDKPMLGDHWRL